MATFDTIGFFVFPNDGLKDDKTEEKEHQEQYLELMYRYQAYYEIIEQKKIVLRGSKLSCEYGTNIARLDCIKDYGVYRGTAPVMTHLDCKTSNIHNFGSCLCPENNYFGRLPYTVGTNNGKNAIKANYNNFAHICAPLINEKSVWHQMSPEILIEANIEGYAPVLMEDAVLVCQYGGIIRIAEAVDDTKVEDEQLVWIPDTIMQLNGNTTEEKYLNDRINTINSNIQNSSKITQTQKANRLWDQNKINLVWDVCKTFYDDYDVQVDPRILIAIIAKEGTGSFNTSSSNLASDGQNGAQDDIIVDLENAIDLLGGKIIAYSYFKEDFSAARKSAFDRGLPGLAGDPALDYDDLFHYLNWETPRLKLMTLDFDVGVYAMNNTWHRGVREIYSNLAYADAPKDYTAYTNSLGKNIFENIARDKGITIKPVEFKAVKNGQDSNGVSNNQYSIVGVIK